MKILKRFIVSQVSSLVNVYFDNSLLLFTFNFNLESTMPRNLYIRLQPNHVDEKITKVKLLYDISLNKTCANVWLRWTNWIVYSHVFECLCNKTKNQNSFFLNFIICTMSWIDMFQTMYIYSGATQAEFACYKNLQCH